MWQTLQLQNRKTLYNPERLLETFSFQQQMYYCVLKKSLKESDTMKVL